jgi:mannose-6-phosphate isomerase-like protein (cupin superfamily)
MDSQTRLAGVLHDHRGNGGGMRHFVSIEEVNPQTLKGNHGGMGPIEFRRLLAQSDFETHIDFVDYTVIPPGSTIGLHEHNGNEEIYFIVTGKPRISVNGQERRLERGSIAVVRSGQTHQLVNDTNENVAIFVIQVRHSQTAAHVPAAV